MPASDHPSLMSPDARLSEIATILARGVLRLHQPQLPTESPLPDLDLPRETVLSVQRG